MITSFDDLFLDQRDSFQGDLDTEVPPGNHDTITLRQNTFKVFYRFTPLNLGNDRYIHTLLSHELSDTGDIIGRSDKRKGQVIRALADGEEKSLPQGVSDKWAGTPHARHDKTSIFGQNPSDDDPALYFAAIHLLDPELHRTIIEENSVTRLHISGKFRYVDRYPCRVTLYLFCYK